MILKKQPPIFSRQGLIRFVIVMILYFFGIYVMKFWQPVDSFELRLAAFIPVAFGMLWGAPAALGSAVGNMLAGAIYGSTVIVTIVAGIANFLLSYLPYRLWYAISSRKASFFVYDARTFLKFVAIMLVVAFDFAFIIASLVRWQYGVPILEDYFITFSNNFDIPIVLGVVLLLYMRSRSDTVYCNFASEKPIPDEDYVASKLELNGQLIILAAVTILDIAAMAVSAKYDVPAGAAMMFMSFTLMGMIYACTIEPKYQPVDIECSNFDAIGAEMTMKYLLTAAVFIVLYAISEVDYSIETGAEWTDHRVWHDMYAELMIVLNVMFVGVYLLLRDSEQHVIKRIEKLTRKVKNYVNRVQGNTDVNKLKSAIANYEENDEIDVLDKSFDTLHMDILQHIDDLTSTIKYNEGMQAQLSVAAEIQQGVLPKLDSVNDKLQELGYEVRAGMQAAKVVGGDMYDCFFIDEDHLAIMVADVSGKGIPASLFMMTTQAMIKNNAPLADPGFILEKSNDTLSRYNDRMMFVTMWLGVLEISTGKMTYANAGHNPPLIMVDGAVTWLKKRSGPVLGIMPDTPYKDREIMIPPGSKLLLYTDGLNEAENSQQELFDNSRLEEAFARQGSIEDVLHDVQEFVGDATQSDDMTYLWLERKS